MISKLLLNAGAKQIYLPQPDFVIRNEVDIESSIRNLSRSKIELSSVHAMSSIPMRRFPINNQIDETARLFGFENIYVVNGSMLPSTIGESPQGTIMAIAKTVYDSWNI